MAIPGRATTHVDDENKQVQLGLKVWGCGWGWGWGWGWGYRVRVQNATHPMHRSEVRPWCACVWCSGVCVVCVVCTAWSGVVVCTFYSRYKAVKYQIRTGFNV